MIWESISEDDPKWAELASSRAFCYSGQNRLVYIPLMPTIRTPSLDESGCPRIGRCVAIVDRWTGRVYKESR